jgi:hypothetical protein
LNERVYERTVEDLNVETVAQGIGADITGVENSARTIGPAEIAMEGVNPDIDNCD